MNAKEILTQNIARLHTTELGAARITSNLSLEEANAVEWCKQNILSPNALVTRNGKNYYIVVDGCIITVNAKSYTIITAHKERSR